ncbi:MAG TPA: hypothetical protein VNH83_07120 [Bryobacteraceae bacterium]|nr:hypothetical protein [Bryobacteraceae bacterium]
MLDNDDFFSALDRLSFNNLLLARLQGSFALRFSPHALDCIHHILLLREKGVSEVGGPLDVACHALQSVWHTGHRLHAGVPWLFGHRISQRLALQIFVILHPLLKLDELQGISGSGESLGQERVGIKSDRRNQRI